MENIFVRKIQEMGESLIANETCPSTISNARNFIGEAFCADDQEINWPLFCEVAKRKKASRFAFWLMYTALERGLSFGEYTKYLVANKQIYKQLLRYKSLKYQSILSGSDLPYQIIIPNSNKNDSFLYYYVKSENKFLIRIARDYLEDNPNFQSGNYNECLPLFAKSFGEKESTIKSVTDFNCELIYDQVAYFRSVFTNEERHLKCAIQFLCYFYRWLVTKYEQKNFFSNSTRITRTLLFQTTFLKWLKEGYHFVNFNSSTIPSGHSKIVYITMGWDRFSTRCASEGSFSVDLTSLSSPAYRELVLLYLVSATSVFTVISLLRPLVKGLEALYKIKTGEEYSYQDIKFLSIDEARYLIDSIDCAYSSVTKSEIIMEFKRFFRWCENEGHMRLEPTALEIFYGRVPSVHSTAETISDDDLTRINNYLRDQIEKSLKDKITYAVFHLLLQTEFRVNQICHLKCSSIVETLKPNEYAIRSINKTSHGEMVEVNITPKTHRVLKNIINETDELRNKTNSSTTDEYIFLYEEGIPTPRIKIYDNTDFRRAILKACSHLGIKNYTASNLRDTYMTKAWEYIVQNGRSDIELSLLTKHAQISTTVNHYLKLDFDDMLEATHEVEIGKINDDEENKTVNDILEATYAVELGKINVGAKNKIVVDIPAEFKSKESDVENGCGKCAAVKCNGNAVLSCLVCDKFFTTPRHEPFFRKAIDQINQQILCSNCRHEKDDLTTIKTLYTEYLKAICLHQERKNEK